MNYTWKKAGNSKIDNLGIQLQKIVRLTNERKIDTRYTYLRHMEGFVKFLAEDFNMQRLRNIQDKHLLAFAKNLNKKGNSSKYIKNVLSGIRYWHNVTENTKFELMDSRKFNALLNLSPTPDGRADRAWTQSEYDDFKAFLEERGQIHYLDMLKAIKCTGMRLDEASTLKVSVVEKALDTGKLHLTNTKGGVPRFVTLSPEALCFFKDKLTRTNSQYLLTPKEYVDFHRIHVFEKNFQKYIYKHRSTIQDSDRLKTGHNLLPGEKSALTAHGLRHFFARDLYKTLINKNISNEKALQIVANQLGHGRSSVTLIYLGA